MIVGEQTWASLWWLVVVGGGAVVRWTNGGARLRGCIRALCGPAGTT